MMPRCGSVRAKAYRASRLSQADRVQKTRRSGWATSEAPWQPGADRTCRQATSALRKTRGTCRAERTSKREAMA
jgi:hypothetical protein